MDACVNESFSTRVYVCYTKHKITFSAFNIYFISLTHPVQNLQVFIMIPIYEEKNK